MVAEHEFAALASRVTAMEGQAAQRFTTALALGVPALGYAGYPSIQDACQGSELCLTTCEAADAMPIRIDVSSTRAWQSTRSMG